MHNIQHILILHTGSSMANMCMQHETACLFQIVACCFKCMLIRLSPFCISTFIFPQWSERIPSTETIYEMHTCQLLIFCCRHFCYRHYVRVCSSTTYFYDLSVQRPWSNDHSNTKQHHCKHAITTKRKWSWKNAIYILSSSWSPQQPPTVLY
jgi:hypothetical protein